MESYEAARLIALSMTASVAGFVAVCLLSRPTPRRDQAAFLAIFVGLYAIYKANDVMTMIDGYATVPMLAILTLPVRFLFGIAIYCYARSMVSPSPRWLQKSDALALIWPAAAAVAIIPFIMMSAEDKNSLMAQDFTSAAMRDWFVQTCKVIFGLFLGSALIYFAAAFRLLLKHVRNLRQLFSNIEDMSLGWLRLVLVILALGWTGNVVVDFWVILGGRPQWVAAMMAFFDFAWLSLIAYFGLQQRPVIPDAAEVPNARYEKSALDEARMDRISRKLEAAMVQDSKYADAALSLRSLSESLGTPDYYVTQTLNKRLGKSFFDFVNSYRVAEARRRLEGSDLAISDIAESVGFNSRSTFNAAFKKHVGMTPRDFRRSSRAKTSAGSVQVHPMN